MEATTRTDAPLDYRFFDAAQDGQFLTYLPHNEEEQELAELEAYFEGTPR